MKSFESDKINSSSLVKTNGMSITDILDKEEYSLIILNDRQGAALGAGHSAMLLGSPIDGWNYYSKDGTTTMNPMSGSASYTFEYYDSLEELANDPARDRYEQAFQFDFKKVGITGKAGQELMFSKLNSLVLDYIKAPYNIKGKNCIDVISLALYDLGFDPGSYTAEEYKSLGWNEKDTVVPFNFKGNLMKMSTFPNFRVDQIVKNNNGIDISRKL